ncbi:hypothetical protein APHAL10511_004995 [Amanita phalloides]|nr:hypothetical protein APHAL10511_004995 [Amanita phalloides]
MASSHTHNDLNTLDNLAPELVCKPDRVGLFETDDEDELEYIPLSAQQMNDRSLPQVLPDVQGVIVHISNLPQLNGTFQDLLSMASVNSMIFQGKNANIPPLEEPHLISGDICSGLSTEDLGSGTNWANVALLQAPTIAMTATLAIAVLTTSGKFLQYLVILHIPMEPTILDLLTSLESDISSNQPLCHILNKLDKKATIISMAVVPLNMKEYTGSTSNWTMGHCTLGSWQDIEAHGNTTYMVKCRQSDRSLEILEAYAPQAAKDTPLYFLIIEELPAAGSSSMEALPTPTPRSKPLIPSAVGMKGHDSADHVNGPACQYLHGMIEPHYFKIVNAHIQNRVASQAAYGHLIFT